MIAWRIFMLVGVISNAFCVAIALNEHAGHFGLDWQATAVLHAFFLVFCAMAMLDDD